MNPKELEKELTNEIIEIVSDYYNVDLTEDSKKRKVSNPRAITGFLISEYTKGISQEFIASKLKRKRSNFSIMIDRIRDSIPFDKELKRDIDTLRIIIIRKSKYLKQSEEKNVLRDVYNLIYDFKIDELLVLKNRLINNSFKLSDNIKDV